MNNERYSDTYKRMIHGDDCCGTWTPENGGTCLGWPGCEKHECIANEDGTGCPIYEHHHPTKLNTKERPVPVPEPEVVRDEDGCPYERTTLRREWRKMQADFESTLSELYDVTAERDKLQKAFALASRFLSDELTCPAVDIIGAEFPDCDGELDECGNVGSWECWQRFFLETVDSERVCRVCGCTQDNACPRGCYWVDDDLCSECAGTGEGDGDDAGEGEYGMRCTYAYQ